MGPALALLLLVGCSENETGWAGRELGMCVSPLSHLHPSFSILGMHIFGCKFSLRTDTGDTVPDRKNFDSLLWAIVTVFQVSPSLCPWVSVAFWRCPQPQRAQERAAACKGAPQPQPPVARVPQLWL